MIDLLTHAGVLNHHIHDSAPRPAVSHSPAYQPAYTLLARRPSNRGNFNIIPVQVHSLSRPGAEGRLCFTLAHEAGHWVLHREFVDLARRDGGFIFCRSRDAKKPVEWQADCFASCLLMPESHVREAFARMCGSRPLVLHNVESAYAGPICFDPCVANRPAIADCVRQAGSFSNVSKQAMIIRLQDLGLVRNETGTPMVWPKRVATA